MMHGRCTHRLLDIRGKIAGVCGDALRFVGIRGAGENVERWYLAPCGFYTVLNAADAVARMTREEPRHGYFNHDHTLCRGKARCVAG